MPKTTKISFSIAPIFDAPYGFVKNAANFKIRSINKRSNRTAYFTKKANLNCIIQKIQKKS